MTFSLFLFIELYVKHTEYMNGIIKSMKVALDDKVLASIYGDLRLLIAANIVLLRIEPRHLTSLFIGLTEKKKLSVQCQQRDKRRQSM